MKTYTICGSMRFEREMKAIAYELEARKGYNVLQCVYCEGNTMPTEAERLRLADAHYRKIDLSDGIYVVNVDGYIGESVTKEKEYAKQHGKEILYHVPLCPTGKT